MKIDKVIQHIVSELNRYCDKAEPEGICRRGIRRHRLGRHLHPQRQDRQEGHGAQHAHFPGKKPGFPVFPAHCLAGKKIHPNVEGIRVDLSDVFLALGSTLPADIQDDLSMANTRSRLRMLTLYAFASHHRFLVVGTGNKVEDFGVGFFTKYGDGGVDISPIADLLKSEVFLLGKALGIIEDILAAPPTDGLWADNRTDESQIGASYAELEWAMAADTGQKTKTLTARQRDVLAIFRRFQAQNRHKMDPIPVIKIPEELR